MIPSRGEIDCSKLRLIFYKSNKLVATCNTKKPPFPQKKIAAAYLAMHCSGPCFSLIFILRLALFLIYS